MTDLFYYALCGLCVAAVLLGINLMSKVKTAVKGNALSAAAMVGAIVLVFVIRASVGNTARIIAICAALAVGAFIGI